MFRSYFTVQLIITITVAWAYIAVVLRATGNTVDCPATYIGLYTAALIILVVTACEKEKYS